MMPSANTEVLKEPRGFIKFLEIIIAIFAFATTTSHHSSSEFVAHCPGGTGDVVTSLAFHYSYKLDDTTFKIPLCPTTSAIHNDTEPGTVHLYGNYSSSAEFYVFVGVMAFLYSLAALALYVVWDERYQQNEKLPIADFIITIVFAALWLISSSAWADAVSKIKHYTDPNDVIQNSVDKWVPECLSFAYANVTCEVTSQGNFASLNVSIIFGFLNMLIWAGNLWFLYKETKWFKPAPASSPDVSSPGTPQKM